MSARRWILGWVLCALGCAQALGVMHRVAHGPLPAGVAALAHQHSGWTDDLFAGHQDDSGCRLFDAIGHDGLPLPPLLPALLTLACGDPVRFATTAFTGRWIAAFQARGPPLSR